MPIASLHHTDHDDEHDEHHAPSRLYAVLKWLGVLAVIGGVVFFFTHVDTDTLTERVSFLSDAVDRLNDWIARVADWFVTVFD